MVTYVASMQLSGSNTTGSDKVVDRGEVYSGVLIEALDSVDSMQLSDVMKGC